jgi:hypothetical protein
VHEYDAALKLLLQSSGDSVLRQMTGISVKRWLSPEIPQVQTSRADLLGARADGKLIHVELQSTNHPKMALRMAEYGLRIYGEHGKFPRQIVLYAGKAPLRMKASWREEEFTFSYTLIDRRTLDGEILLSSAAIEDNLLAILTRLRDQKAAIRQILKRIASLDAAERKSAFAQFLIISGLRRLAPAIREEAQNMPILNDIMDHEVIGPAIRQGEKSASLKLVKLFIEKRFGAIPASVEARLADMSTAELDLIAERAFDGASLEELLPKKVKRRSRLTR